MAQIFVCNIGSTSTKVGYFLDKQQVKEHTIRYSPDDFKGQTSLFDQQARRTQDIESFCAVQGINLSSMDVIVVRGGVIKPLMGGIYAIDENVLDDVRSMRYGKHASNLGLLIGYDWKNRYGVDVVFVDPPVTDELSLLARYS